MPSKIVNEPMRNLLIVGCLVLASHARAADGPANWVPPTASDWTSLANRLESAYQREKKLDKRISAGVLWGPMVSVDRTDGTLYAFPQGGPLWVSRDRGQSFEWLNHDVASWGFNESPTNMFVSPDGRKMRIFSSDRSGHSSDGGRTWKYMNFNLKFGFEDGQINWHGDGKMIVARSHTWPSRMWISRDAGETFVEFQPEILKQINTQNIALLADDVLLVQSEKLMRSEDYGQTVSEVAQPAYAGANGKPVRSAFIGLSRTFKDKTYWLNTTGVYTTADKGKSWTIVGSPFPDEWVQKRMARSGPLIGKDENQLLVLCPTQVVESLDAGKSWHVLAELPTRLHDEPYAFSFAYDPIGDIVYCNNRGHSGGPYLFGRLALKRWGDVEQVAPTTPAELRAEPLAAGNGVKLSWNASTDASGIYAYRVYVDGALTYQTERPEIVLSGFAWEQELKVEVQAVDAWQNVSAKASTSVRLGARPAGAVLLKDTKPATASFDGAAMEILTDSYKAADKSTQPVTILVDGYEPNPIPHYVSKPAAYGIGIRIKPTFKQGVLEYDLDQKYVRLLVDVGMSHSQWDHVQMKVSVDGREISAPKPLDYEARLREIGRKAEALDVDLSGAKTLRFEVKVMDDRYWQEDVLGLGNGMLVGRK